MLTPVSKVARQNKFHRYRFAPSVPRLREQWPFWGAGSPLPPKFGCWICWTETSCSVTWTCVQTNFHNRRMANHPIIELICVILFLSFQKFLITRLTRSCTELMRSGVKNWVSPLSVTVTLNCISSILKSRLLQGWPAWKFPQQKSVEFSHRLLNYYSYKHKFMKVLCRSKPLLYFYILEE